ncbi:hypothetical protein CVT26_001777 [Gymnopilus dilepis]|uniref:Jacalin-type lectin domain-containing protein n=1 Tax=Gymnopilus dilepis TaxID=231916 RepID=A0A409Y405_9AGAR|nr:hypothetical protein CVT26_001777 [Gymnopilus dilepis]
MSSGVAVNTSLAGAAQGSFINDLTNPSVGQWPQALAIKRISKIDVCSGDIIDSISITYEMTNGTEVVQRHGGEGGVPSLSVVLGAEEKIVAIYGRRLQNACAYGNSSIVQLTFIIADTNSSGPNASVRNPSINANYLQGHAAFPFELSWPLVAASSYTNQPENMPLSYLQGIAFARVFGQAT